MTNAERQKKYREKRNAEREKLIEIVTQSVTDESKTVTPTVTVEDVIKCPEGIDAKEWEYACKRARGSRKYAEMFPDFIRPSDLQFQDPFWQWENEVKNRFKGKFGDQSDNQQKGN